MGLRVARPAAPELRQVRLLLSMLVIFNSALLGNKGTLSATPCRETARCTPHSCLRMQCTTEA